MVLRLSPLASSGLPSYCTTEVFFMVLRLSPLASSGLPSSAGGLSLFQSRLMPSTEITSMTASAFSFCSLTHTRTHLPQAYRNIWRYETAPHKMLSSAFAQFFQSYPYWFPPARPADPVLVPHRYEAFLNSSGTPSQHITIPLLF